MRGFLDATSSTVTFRKRKRGLIKKAMELNMLCQKQVYIAIYDKENNRLVEYTCDTDFNASTIDRLAQDQSVKLERYDNQDYQECKESQRLKEKKLVPKKSQRKRQCRRDEVEVFGKDRESSIESSAEEGEASVDDQTMPVKRTDEGLRKAPNKEKMEQMQKLIVSIPNIDISEDP